MQFYDDQTKSVVGAGRLLLEAEDNLRKFCDAITDFGVQQRSGLGSIAVESVQISEEACVEDVSAEDVSVEDVSAKARDDNLYYDKTNAKPEPEGRLRKVKINFGDAEPFMRFGPGRVVPVACVDCGIMRLGDTELGPVVALRAAIVIQEGGRRRLMLLRTGPLLLPKAKKAEILYLLGERMGQRDYYVHTNDQGSVLEVKHGAADDDATFCHRLRAFWEREAQLCAVHAVENGLILLDGTLNSRGRDTPVVFWRRLARAASSQGNSVVGISKTSELDVLNRNVRWWLDDHGGAGYRDLTPIMQWERRESNLETDRHRARSLGFVVAARFSYFGPTMRIDVLPAAGASLDESLSILRVSCGMRLGYPALLIAAHGHTYWPRGHVAALRAQALKTYRLSPRLPKRVEGFGPFGGTYK